MSARTQRPVARSQSSSGVATPINAGASAAAASPFADGVAFLSFAAQALSRDEFSRCFEPGPASAVPASRPLAALYICGLVVRYGVLFPLRIVVLLIGVVVIVVLLPICALLLRTRTRLGRVVTRTVFSGACSALLFCFSAVVRHHRVRNDDRVMNLLRPRRPPESGERMTSESAPSSSDAADASPDDDECLADRDGVHAEAPVEGLFVAHASDKPNPIAPHIFVANHTSWIDFILMSSWGVPHATVAQIHGGLFGVLQRHALTLNGSLFFNRAEARDRVAVAQRMQAHIAQRPQLAPLLVFPEGTCVNNEYTVLFHKGAFELGGALVCPVAIKYNKRLSDPYWNTREQSFTQHLLYLMTRWLLVADVWWLPPQARRPDEDGIGFAERVKALISEAAGLRNLSWDGYMKNCMRARDRERMLQTSQEHYAHSLRARTGTVTPAPSLDDTRSSTERLLVPDAKDTVQSPQNALRPYLPAWLDDTALTDIKNELLQSAPPADTMPSAPSSADLIRDMRAQRSDLVAAWRGPAPESLVVPAPVSRAHRHVLVGDSEDLDMDDYDLGEDSVFFMN